MDSRSRALYLALMQDLKPHLCTETLAKLTAGVEVLDWADATPTQQAALALARSFYKKNIDSIAPTADNVALNKFLSVNKRLESWSLELNTSWDEILVGTLKQVVYEFFYPDGDPLIDSVDQILSDFRCGPGASVDSPGSDLYSKLFSSSLSCSSEVLYRGYRGYIEEFPTWLAAEKFRESQMGSPKVVKENRLRFVPKTRDVSRTICIEPVLNMSYQLGIGAILERRLKSFFGIDVGIQPDINRELCRRGSKDGSFCTIDLESASDSLGLSMLREILPSRQMGWLMLARSPSSKLPDGNVVKLNMISTMGNGYTFPLQTMLFASIVFAAARARGFHLERPRAASDATFGVFGDDIILPTGCHYNRRLKEFTDFGDFLRRDVYRLLEILGFVVNTKKSFYEGPFRESCGCDFYKGRNVRGVYIKTLQTTQSRFVAINLLNRWSATTGIPLRATCKMLLRSVPLYRVPLFESDDAGVKVPLDLVPQLKYCRYTGSVLYRAFVSKVTSWRIGDGVIFGNKRLLFNEEGLLLAFLSGAIRSHKISVRSNRLSYASRFRVAPNWDYLGTDGGLSPSGRSLMAAIASNIK